MKWSEEILSYIRRNRVTTTEIADCLGKTGAIKDVLPVNSGLFKAGIIHWTYASYSSNWQVHKDVIDVEEGAVVFIESFDCEDRSIIGELVSKYILLYRQAAAIVVTAPMRDAGAIIRENYAIWSKGVSPVGCFNQQAAQQLPEGIINEHRERYDGAIAVCDDSGVVVIPKAMHTEAFYQKIIKMEEQEDIWFERLDRMHENTFEIVCEKKYLKEKAI